MDGCSGIFNATRFRGLLDQLSSVQESGKSFCQFVVWDLRGRREIQSAVEK